MSMGLNLKDEETVALVTEVAKRLGTTKTGAVRELAREKLARLDRDADDKVEARVTEVEKWLAEHVWPHTAGLPPITKDDIEEITGMNEMFDE